MKARVIGITAAENINGSDRLKPVIVDVDYRL